MYTNDLQSVIERFQVEVQYFQYQQRTWLYLNPSKCTLLRSNKIAS